MIEIPYSLVIEATEDPEFFAFHSPDLVGFTGVGHSVEDCLYRAKWGIREHVEVLREQGLPVPPVNPNPRITIRWRSPGGRVTSGCRTPGWLNTASAVSPPARQPRPSGEE